MEKMTIQWERAWPKAVGAGRRRQRLPGKISLVVSTVEMPWCGGTIGGTRRRHVIDMKAVVLVVHQEEGQFLLPDGSGVGGEDVENLRERTRRRNWRASSGVRCRPSGATSQEDLREACPKLNVPALKMSKRSARSSGCLVAGCGRFFCQRRTLPGRSDIGWK